MADVARGHVNHLALLRIYSPNIFVDHVAVLCCERAVCVKLNLTSAELARCCLAECSCSRAKTALPSSTTPYPSRFALTTPSANARPESQWLQDEPAPRE
jgi:hypothetical protein